jgi:hypothetical protein
VVHSEIEAAAQGDYECAISLVDIPSSLADHADIALRGTEPPPFDAGLRVARGSRSMTPPARAAE